MTLQNCLPCRIRVVHSRFGVVLPQQGTGCTTLIQAMIQLSLNSFLILPEPHKSIIGMFIVRIVRLYTWKTLIALWWHCTKSSDCQVRVWGAPWNCYGVNLTKALIGAYMWQWWHVQILWHLPYVFSSFCWLMNYCTVTFATCWYIGCVNLTVVTVNFL